MSRIGKSVFALSAECVERIGEDHPEEELLFSDLFEDETQRIVVI